MSAERLLKRIRYWGRGDVESVSRIDASEYKKSVLEDIKDLYNTQKGTVLISNEMGVPDFTSMLNRLGPNEIETITQSLREVTEKYEPRMKNVTVRHHPREEEYGVMRFLVNAGMSFKENDIAIEYAAIVQGNGSVEIEG